MLIAFERLEALRYAHFLKKDGVIIINDWRIDPITVVTGAAEYPENIIEDLSRTYKVYSINGMEEAIRLGNAKAFNTVVLGMAARHMDFAIEDWLKIIEKTVPGKTVEINQKAFLLGYGLEIQTPIQTHYDKMIKFIIILDFVTKGRYNDSVRW